MNQVRKWQNQYLHSNTGDGTLPQATPGETRPKVGGARDKFLRGHFILFFCYSWFRLQSMAIHCNRRGVQTGTPHTSFFSCTVRMLNDVSHHIGSRTCSWVIQYGRLIVCSFSVPRLVPFCVSLLHLALLFPLLPVLCPEPLLPCGQRQGN